MTSRSSFNLGLALFCATALSACEGDYFSNVETFYSYIQVGACKDGYYGDVYTPNGRISNCLGLLTTAVSLNVSQSTQTVTLIEENLGFNKQPTTMRLSATKLENCSIVDKSNFSCNGLERKDGKFVNTSAIGWRRLSSSKVCASVARYWGNGWVDDAILNLHDHEWMGIVYLLVIFGGAFMVILAI